MTEKGIELLDKVFQKHKVKKKTEKQKERQEDLSTRKKKKLFYGEEAKLLPKKINLYKQIIAWRNKFIKSKQFNRVFSEFDELIIFWSKWGHLEFSEFGGWSRLYLEETGKLRYFAGYKGMPTGPEIVFTDNLKNAEEFTYKYLEELYKLIETDKIYKNIAEEVNEKD